MHGSKCGLIRSLTVTLLIALLGEFGLEAYVARSCVTDVSRTQRPRAMLTLHRIVHVSASDK